jgi:orotate phosphoribosyltransferase
MIKHPPDKIGLETAAILLDIEAVLIASDTPFTLTSGRKSPVYIDGRRLISFVEERRKVIQHAANILESCPAELLAGGESAGIPYAAWLSEAMNKPMLYVRKKPKGFGRMAQIEGVFTKNQNVMLVEDLTTDGGTKIEFCKVLRDAGAKVTDIFSVFYYDSFPEAETEFSAAGLNLHYLTSWKYILQAAADKNKIAPETVNDLQVFLSDPVQWSLNAEKRV